MKGISGFKMVWQIEGRPNWKGQTSIIAHAQNMSEDSPGTSQMNKGGIFDKNINHHNFDCPNDKICLVFFTRKVGLLMRNLILFP